MDNKQVCLYMLEIYKNIFSCLDKDGEPYNSKEKESPKELSNSNTSSLIRHPSHALTPAISEVYHERNIGLGLAPPLSTLLLTNDLKNENDKFDGEFNEFLKRDEGDGRSVADSQCSSHYKALTNGSEKATGMLRKMQMMSIKSNSDASPATEGADKEKKGSSKIVKKCLYRKKNPN